MNPIADLKMSPVERTEFNVLGTAFIDITLFDKKKADQKALDKKAQEESGDPAAKGEKTKMGENRLSWKNEFGIDVTNADETYFKPYYKINDAFKREADAANLSTGDYKNNSIRFSSYATWLRDFNKKHNLNLMLGTEFNKYSYEGLVMKYYGYEEGAIPLPTASTSSKTVGSNFKGEGSMASFFGRGVYSIAGKYILTATGRFDGSSNFAPGNKWGFFPSFSFAWRLEEEEWAKGKFKDVFSSFKVRAGYGQTGNANCAQAHLATVTNIGQSGTYSPGTYTNQNLKWETNSMINMGLDFGFQKSKLNVTIDGYYKKNKDLLLLQELPTYIAQSDYKYITPSYVNAGSIQNVGMDLQLSRRVERDVNERLKFAWESDLTFSLVRSKVLDLGSSCEAIYNNPQYALFSTKYNINRTVVDEAPGKFWGYKYIGIAQNQDEANAYNERTGRNIGVGDMMLSDEETWIGDPNPAFTAGWANSFSLGQWTLGVQFNATVGNDVYNLVRMKLENNAGDAKWWNQSADVLNYAVVKEVDGKKVVVNDSSIPAPTGTDKGQKSVSDRYVEDGSFLRLQNVALTYRFRPEANRKLHIDGLRISASCSNVCTITGYSGYDPENPGGATRQGVDEARYPSPRTYTLGLGFSF